MCGIVGYIGDKAIDSVLLVGLTRLEYRGYDSAGIAVVDHNELIIRKERGKIKDLERLLQLKPVEGSMGIGHTRWATHGPPSPVNAHPHSDCKNKIAIVHNGIIENHQKLRTRLTAKGHVFKTETDSEVIAHLIEQEINSGVPVEEAVRRCIQELEGKYAFAMVYEGEPEKVFFAREGSPLVFGRGTHESFLASDISAVIPGAKEQYSFHNGQWGWITRDGLNLFDHSGKPESFELSAIEVNVQDLDRKGFDHFMLKEIFEQPDIIRKIILERTDDNGKIHFPEMNLPLDYLGRVSRILITSAGTSWHSGMVGKLYLERFAKIMTEVDISSEFRYRNPIAEGDTLVLAISQSGETADTLAGIHEAKSKFMNVLSFVNNTHSTIARESNAFIDLLAGMEIGVASTKAYTAQLLNMLLFSMFLAGIKWLLPREDRIEMFEQIRRLPELIQQILEKSGIIQEWAKELKSARDFVFLGRNYNHPTALEGALKLKEISYVHASGYAGGEFKHGPIALITSEVPVVAIAPQTEVYEKMVSNIEEVKARQGIILSIHTEGDTRVPELSDYSFAIPEAPDYLTPILASIPLQLLAYYMAIERGCEPDQPRNLAKSVTVE